VALLIPGRGYTPDMPLLHFARAVLGRHGWTTQQLWWSTHPPADTDACSAWVNVQVAAALDRESAQSLLLVGKSLGTLAVTVAAERELPAMWLTPLLNEPWLVEQLRRTAAPTLLIGGTADGSWIPTIVRSLQHSYLELDGADHALETHDDPVNSAELLSRVTAAMDAFVAALRAPRAADAT
jgi:hypothetical protein